MGRPVEQLPGPTPADPAGARGGTAASQLRASGLATQVEIHDRQQLEVRFNHAIGSEAGAQRHVIDTYFFIPRNVGVNRTNFSREGFYADVTALMRLDAAPLPLCELADETCTASPLHRFARAVEDFRQSPRPPPSRPVSVHVKLYAHLFAVAVTGEISRLRQLAREVGQPRGGSPAELEREILGALDRMRLGLHAYRRVRAAFWPFEKLCHESLVEAMRGSDEYMSLLLEERLAQFVAQVDALPPRDDAPALAVRVRLLLAGIAREEAAYRRKYGYLTLSRDALGAGEYFTYRSSLLKKSVQQALYLDPREVRVDTFLRNAVGAVAAALGAIWATALAMQLPGNLGTLPSGTKTLFFAAAVGAYVMKDRIKALTGEWLGRRLRQHDHTSWLYGESLATVGLGMLRARQQEAMRFVGDHEVPADIQQMRLSRRTVQNAELLHEEVIHYRKTLEVSTRDDAQPLPDGYRVRDILRLNVRHFLVRLDDPLDRVDFFDPARGAFARADLPKVYHLNMVVKVTRENTEGAGHERLEHLRVVLNKDGIVRVEQVAAVGPNPLAGAGRRLRLPIRLRLRGLGR